MTALLELLTHRNYVQLLFSLVYRVLDIFLISKKQRSPRLHVFQFPLLALQDVVQIKIDRIENERYSGQRNGAVFRAGSLEVLRPTEKLDCPSTAESAPSSTNMSTELCTLDLLYFDGVEIEDCEPRAIFIPNACHVCKAMRHDSNPKDQVKLLSCSGCRLIAYCGPEHQKQHWPQHKVGG